MTTPLRPPLRPQPAPINWQDYAARLTDAALSDRLTILAKRPRSLSPEYRRAVLNEAADRLLARDYLACIDHAALDRAATEG